MKIKSMTATFGKLNSARLTPGPGLTLIHAPNEGGKSTWCAFWRAMLYGIDTRDRDKKGYLADKNRYQPWSGAPMAGELEVEWQGRDITIRRGPRGNTPFGAFSAVYTGTEEPVPGLTAVNCGEMLTGAGQELFARSAFLGGGNLSLTTAPELERRIAALVSSGEEDVSFSQAQAQLKEWRNKRQVNKSVGEIPRLEGELSQVRTTLEQLEEVTGRIARLEGERAALEEQQAQLAAQMEAHRLLARRELAGRYAQAQQEYQAARDQLTALERERGEHPLPDREALKRAQGELQYLKVLDEEIQQGEGALKEAEEAYVQAQIAAQDENFAGMTGEEASQLVDRQLRGAEHSRARAKTWRGRGILFCALAAAILLGFQIYFSLNGGWAPAAWWFSYGLPLLAVALALFGGYCLLRSGRSGREGGAVLQRYQVQSQEELSALVRDYATRVQAADRAAEALKAVRGSLNDRKARRDNSRADLLQFVHTFAPEARDLFGCSAALSRGLSLDHELEVARERVEERRRRLDDLSAQGGGQPCPEGPVSPPELGPEETARALGQVESQLDLVKAQLNQARGRQRAMGDPASLAARQEALEGDRARRQLEYDALTLAMDTLVAANARLQERFSPELNRLAGQYMARLTGEKYSAVSLTRELEGAVQAGGDVSPRSALYLSRGTLDQLYLSVRLAVCQLCLPERPPIILDDALTAFDDQRLPLALELLRELARDRQILLFSCQRREGELAARWPEVTRLSL